MGNNYQSQVKVVGVIEIVFQVIGSIFTLVTLGLLIFGTAILLNLVGSGEIGDENKQAASVVSGIFIGIIVIMVLNCLFNAWLVWLVFTGGRTNNKKRLTIWFIIQAVLTAFLIAATILSFVSLSIVSGIVFIIFTTYRIYAIHVVRCHAKEISNLSPSAPIAGNNRF